MLIPGYEFSMMRAICARNAMNQNWQVLWMILILSQE